MSKRLGTNPKQDGYRMPAEYEKQERIWMLWPERTDNWRNGAKPAQNTFVEVANTISKYEEVIMLVSHNQFENARFHLNEKVKVMECSNDDSWMRDCGPTFVKNDKGGLRANDWIFNAWGGISGGLYFPWDKDDKVAWKTAEIANVDTYRANFVLEGGSIHVDGEGTLYTTEECLLNENRNPDLSKAEIENNMKNYLNIEKIIWLPLGVFNDETNGHVDNMIQIVEPGHVVLTWTDDKNDPQFDISNKALKVLENSTNAKGRKIKVTKLHQPGPLFFTESEASTIDAADGMARESGTRLAGSYANFLIANDCIILPIFDDKWDDNALKVIKKIFPNRKIETIMAREILLGGGNIHCITQQQPVK